MARSKQVTTHATRRRSYHHGDLRAALLSAAWNIVAEEGVEALTLRACARRAGVSHAAPENHFGSVAGLMEEFAADGYERMDAIMNSVAAEHADQPLLAAGLGYVRFAEEYPEQFRIITKIAAPSAHSARLREASRKARMRLEDALRAAYLAMHGCELSLEELAARAGLAWSCVHGFATLRADGLASNTDLPDVATLLRTLRPSLMSLSN